MSENNISWFHCARCGSLFRSPAGESDQRLCSECGLNPSLGIEFQPSAANAAPAAVESTGRAGEPERSSRKKRKRSYFMVKLIAGWTAVILLIIFGARYRWGEQAPKKPFVSKVHAKVTLSAEDAAFLNENGPRANRTFSGFLAAGVPEERNQFVLSPVITASRMARFHALNPLVNIPPETLSLSKNAILRLPAGNAIETLWNTTDGLQIDAVFVEQEGEWRLDWDHFARFSTYPWALFLAGSGDEQGEFRLLARQRLAEERKNEDSLSIVLYAPRFGTPREPGFQSPEFLVRRDSRNGRLLDAAFKLEKDGKRPFEVNIPSPDPEEFIRVRVKVKRIEDPAGRRFELEEVLACHWYSVDAPGVEIPQAPLQPEVPDAPQNTVPADASKAPAEPDAPVAPTEK